MGLENDKRVAESFMKNHWNELDLSLIKKWFKLHHNDEGNVA